MALLLAAVLCCLLAGCGGAKAPAPGEATENPQTQASEAPVKETPTPDKKAPASETPGPDQKAAAREAYLDFLNGKGTVTTTEAFQQKEEGYSLFPAYGTYSYEELKYAAADEMMGNGIPRYTFLDVGGDGGAELLVLRFENEDSSCLNWTGVIRYDDGALTMTYSYEDGYRFDAELFTSGFLSIGGSGGAGAYEESGQLLEKDGTARPLYEAFDYWGSFAPDIQYRLEEPQNDPMEKRYFELPATFCIRGYSDENGLRVYVEESGDPDPETLALEEDFADELTERGVQLVDWETYKGLGQVSQYTTQEVTWTDFDDGLPSQMG